MTDVVAGMAKVGLPAMLEQMLMRTGLIIYSRTVSTLGELNLAYISDLPEHTIPSL